MCSSAFLVELVGRYFPQKTQKSISIFYKKEQKRNNEKRVKPNFLFLFIFI
tara:strand:- start:673 stop:825 length:153 start_codon:yes stop_codon:yes gene_type:complete